MIRLGWPTSPMRSRYRNVLFALLAAFVLLAVTACPSVDDTVAREVQEIDQLITNVNANSAAWRYEFDQIINALPQAEAAFKADLLDIVNTTETGIGKVVQCSTAFVGSSAVLELRRLRAKLLGQAAPVNPPTICDTAPIEVDPTNLGAKPQTVTYFGFNFQETPLDEILVAKSGAQTDVTNQLHEDSVFSYHISLGGTTGVSVTRDDARLDLHTAGGVYSVSINAAALPLCVQRTGPLAAFNGNIQPLALPLARVNVHGDSDWYGHGPKVHIAMQTIVEPADIKINFSMAAAESPPGDGTYAQMTSQNIVYIAPPGYAIVGLPGARLTDDYPYTHTGSGTIDILPRGSDSIVSQYVVNVGSGSKAAEDTSLTIQFNPQLQITLFGPPFGYSACANPLRQQIVQPVPVHTQAIDAARVQ